MQERVSRADVGIDLPAGRRPWRTSSSAPELALPRGIKLQLAPCQTREGW